MYLGARRIFLDFIPKYKQNLPFNFPSFVDFVGGVVLFSPNITGKHLLRKFLFLLNPRFCISENRVLILCIGF
jgi:hypothetical protein